MRDQLSALITS